MDGNSSGANENRQVFGQADSSLTYNWYILYEYNETAADQGSSDFHGFYRVRATTVPEIVGEEDVTMDAAITADGVIGKISKCQRLKPQPGCRMWIPP